MPGVGHEGVALPPQAPLRTMHAVPPVLRTLRLAVAAGLMLLGAAALRPSAAGAQAAVNQEDAVVLIRTSNSLRSSRGSESSERGKP